MFQNYKFSSPPYLCPGILNFDKHSSRANPVYNIQQRYIHLLLSKTQLSKMVSYEASYEALRGAVREALAWAATVAVLLLLTCLASPHQTHLFTPSSPSDTSAWSWLLTTIVVFYLLSVSLAASVACRSVSPGGRFSYRSASPGGMFSHVLKISLTFAIFVLLTWGPFADLVETFLMRAGAFLAVAFRRVPAWKGLSADGVYNAYHATCQLNQHPDATCAARYLLHYTKALPRNIVWAASVRESYDTYFSNFLRSHPYCAMLWIASCELLFSCAKHIVFP
ncbi:hypothetical protein RB597_005431 [Gaeumannomyces tritici]